MTLTRADKQVLRDLGYSNEAISHMTPDVGEGIIARREVAPRAEGQATVQPQGGQPAPAQQNRRNDGANGTIPTTLPPDVPAHDLGMAEVPACARPRCRAVYLSIAD
jgi:hypothetical protein